MYDTNGHGCATMNFRIVLLKLEMDSTVIAPNVVDVRVSNLLAVGYFPIKILYRLWIICGWYSVVGNARSVGSKHNLEWLNLLTKVKGSSVLFDRKLFYFQFNAKKLRIIVSFSFNARWLKIGENSKKVN